MLTHVRIQERVPTVLNYRNGALVCTPRSLRRKESGRLP